MELSLEDMELDWEHWDPLVEREVHQQCAGKYHKEGDLWAYHLWMDLHCTLSSFGGGGREEGLPQ